MEKIKNKCIENNLTFIAFVTENGLYKNNQTKLHLKCNQCGYEWKTTTYYKFLNRTSKCPVCNCKKKRTKEDFLKKILLKCEKENYLFIEFVNNPTVINRDTKLKLQCNNCGKIWDSTTINNFLKDDRKSHKCGRKNSIQSIRKYKDINTINEEIKTKLQGTTLTFLRVVSETYRGIKKCDIEVYCNICKNTFILSYGNLLRINNVKCKKCEIHNKIKHEDAFNNIKTKCDLVGYTFIGFNTDNGRYNGKNTKLVLQCNDCGRIWKTTTYSAFLNKTIKCNGCSNVWQLEKEVKYILDKNSIIYDEQKTFEWLKYDKYLTLDFFLPEYNIGVECQGRQHFMPVSKFGGSVGFEKTKIRDNIKFEKCLDNNIQIIYFTYKKFPYFNKEKTINNENDLLNRIYNGK